MLRVVALPDGAWYLHVVLDQSITPAEYLVDDFLVGPFSPQNFGIGGVTEIAAYDGRIINDPLRDRVGDREVFHDQISGTVDLPNFRQSPSVAPAGYTYVFPVNKVDGYAPERRFRHILTPGREVSYSYQSTTDRYLSIYHRKIMFDGKNFCYAVGYRRTKGSSYFYGKSYYFTIRSASVSGVTTWMQTGANLANEAELFDVQPRELGSGTSKLYSWTKPQPYAYDTEKLKNCFYWLNERATDPGKFFPAFVQQNPLDYGDLCQAAIEQARAVDVNTLAFLSELRDISTLIPKIGKVKDPKTWANLYLCYKYGALLTLADMKKLTQGIEAAFTGSRDLGGLSVVRSSLRRGGVWGGHPYVEECRYKITYRPYPNRLMEVVRTLDRWGLYPTLTRDWDIIPFSFVLDWVLDVSSALERLDVHMIADYYNVVGVTRSRKVEFPLPVTSLVPDWPGSGLITLSRYTRDTTPLLDLPKVRFDGNEEGFSNWAELTALVISRGK